MGTAFLLFVVGGVNKSDNRAYDKRDCDGGKSEFLQLVKDLTQGVASHSLTQYVPSESAYLSEPCSLQSGLRQETGFPCTLQYSR